MLFRSVITNSLGCGDWVRVIVDGERLIDDSKIRPFDLVMLLQKIGYEAQLVALTDKEMEEL